MKIKEQMFGKEMKEKVNKKGRSRTIFLFTENKCKNLIESI